MGWAGRVPGYRQIYVQSQVAANFITGTEGTLVLPPFLVMTPDSRLRTKVTILWSGPNVIFPTPLGTLYLVEMEQDFGGSSASLIQSVALEGTQVAPTSLPKNPGLLGYSKEFVTAGDAIQGNLSIAPGFGAGGQVVIQARWQPDGQRLPAEEWDEIVTLCNIQVSQVKT